MTTTKSWQNLTTIVSTLAEKFLTKKDQRTKFLEEWTSQKSKVVKLMNRTTQKKQKDPNAPTKAKTSYILYCMDMRQSVKDKNPDMKATEITSKLGKMWNALSDNKKSQYNKKAEEDKKRYEQEMESYTPPENSGGDSAAGKKRKRDPNSPKKPLSAYMLYCKDAREELKDSQPDLKGKDVMREMAKGWKKLSDDEKAPYEAEAEAAREKYNDEKGTVKKDSDKKPAKTTKTTKATKPTKDTKTTKSAKPAKTSKEAKESKGKRGAKQDPAFDTFAAEKRSELQDEHPEWSDKKLTSEVNKSWKALSEEDRDAYKLQTENEPEERHINGKHVDEDDDMNLSDDD